MTDGDFEKMFGKDIDQYLEGSDFDLDEFEHMSGASYKGNSSQAQLKLKNMEKMYLHRHESSTIAAKNSQQSRQKTEATSQHNIAAKSNKKPPAFREFQDRFVDLPDFVHRGQILEFETAKQSQSNSRKKRI